MTHYRYKRKSYLPSVDQDVQQVEGCPGKQQGIERLTQVEYATQKALEIVIQADHAGHVGAIVVTRMKLFITAQQVTEVGMATNIRCTTDKLSLWIEGKQDNIQMERKYDQLIQQVLLDFEEFQTEKTGTTASVVATATAEGEDDTQQ